MAHWFVKGAGRDPLGEIQNDGLDTKRGLYKIRGEGVICKENNRERFKWAGGEYIRAPFP